MKHHIFIFISLFILFAFSCKTKNKAGPKAENLDTIKKLEPTTNVQVTPPSIPDFSTDLPFFSDTKELKKKRADIFKNFSPMGSDYDTLVDINYDGYRDYLIGYYGAAGTGFKYKIEAYVFSKKRGGYVHDKEISSLVNPSFFISEHKVTGFYIGLGAGSGRKLEWIKNKWIITKEFEVDNQGDSTIWNIYYPLTKKKEEVRKPFQGIPPNDILESNHYF